MGLPMTVNTVHRLFTVPSLLLAAPALLAIAVGCGSGESSGPPETPFAAQHDAASGGSGCCGPN
jgi:hypothetical protein